MLILTYYYHLLITNLTSRWIVFSNTTRVVFLPLDYIPQYDTCCIPDTGLYPSIRHMLYSGHWIISTINTCCIPDTGLYPSIRYKLYSGHWIISSNTTQVVFLTLAYIHFNIYNMAYIHLSKCNRANQHVFPILSQTVPHKWRHTAHQRHVLEKTCQC